RQGCRRDQGEGSHRARQVQRLSVVLHHGAGGIERRVHSLRSSPRTHMCGNERGSSIATLSLVTLHPGRIGARGALLAAYAVLARLRFVVEAPPILLALLRVAGGAEHCDENDDRAKRSHGLLQHGRSPECCWHHHWCCGNPVVM